MSKLNIGNIPELYKYYRKTQKNPREKTHPYRRY